MQYKDLKEDAVIYLAGPMRGYELFNFPAFERVTADLRKQGKQVYSPHEYDLNNGFDPSKGTLEGWDAKKAFKWDLAMVIEADAVVVLPGWEKSEGALLECWTAMIVGVPIFSYNYALPLYMPLTEHVVPALCEYFMKKEGWEEKTANQTDSSAITQPAKPASTEATPIGDGGTLRYNDGKLRWSLVPLGVLRGLGEVLSWGAQKYAAHNWMRGAPWSQAFDSCMRHLTAWFCDGEDRDKESGLHHLDHAIANLVFLKHWVETYPAGDDRPPHA